MNFLKWYKNIFESNELDPPPETWGQIQDQLDIDNSWQVIDKTLHTRARPALRIRIAAAASLLILVAAGASWIYISSLQNTGPGEEIAEAMAPGVSTGKEEEPAGDLVRGESTAKKEDVAEDIAPGRSSHTGEVQ